MATTLSTSISVTLKATYTNVLDIGNAVANFTKTFSDKLTDGTGLDNADLIFWDTRTVTNGTPDDLDLAGGLTDAFGNTLTFVKVKGIMIVNNSATAGEILTLGGDANGFINWLNPATATQKVGPGGVLQLHLPSAAGYAVTAATGDILQIAADAGSISYDIILIGTSA